MIDIRTLLFSLRDRARQDLEALVAAGVASTAYAEGAKVLAIDEFLSPVARKLANTVRWTTALIVPLRAGGSEVWAAEMLAVKGTLLDGEPNPANVRRLAEAFNRGVERGAVAYGVMGPAMMYPATDGAWYVAYPFKPGEITEADFVEACGSDLIPRALEVVLEPGDGFMGEPPPARETINPAFIINVDNVDAIVKGTGHDPAANAARAAETERDLAEDG